LLVVGAVFQVVEFVLEIPLTENTAGVAFWEQHLTRAGLSQAVGLLAVPFLLGGVAVMVAVARAWSARLAWTAGCLLVCAMVGLAAIHGVELTAYGLVRW
jgi:hypothetical protein